MSPRADEDFCRDAFDKYLRTALGEDALSWTPFPKGESHPPDFSLHCSSTSYSVEITGLMTQYAMPNGSTVPEETISQAISRLTDRVEEKALSRGCPPGLYTITLDGPYCNFFDRRGDLEGQVLRLIASGQADDYDPSDGLRFRELPSGQRFALTKYPSETLQVAWGMFSDGGGWGWEAAREMRQLVEAAVASKASKMKAVSPPRLLLLLDRHYFALEYEIREIQKQLAPGWAAPAAPAQEFHSIYLVRCDRSVFRMHGGLGETCG